MRSTGRYTTDSYLLSGKGWTVRIALIVHGGAWNIPDTAVEPSRRGVRAALDLGLVALAGELIPSFGATIEEFAGVAQMVVLVHRGPGRR